MRTALAVVLTAALTGACAGAAPPNVVPAASSAAPGPDDAAAPIASATAAPAASTAPPMRRPASPGAGARGVTLSDLVVVSLPRPVRVGPMPSAPPADLTIPGCTGGSLCAPAGAYQKVYLARVGLEPRRDLDLKDRSRAAVAIDQMRAALTECAADARTRTGPIGALTLDMRAAREGDQPEPSIASSTLGPDAAPCVLARVKQGWHFPADASRLAITFEVTFGERWDYVESEPRGQL